MIRYAIADVIPLSPCGAMCVLHFHFPIVLDKNFKYVRPGKYQLENGPVKGGKDVALSLVEP